MNRRSFLRVALVGAGAAIGVGASEVVRSYFFAPPGGWKAEGVPVRLVQQYSVDFEFYRPNRLDVLYGVGRLRPELACRQDGKPLGARARRRLKRQGTVITRPANGALTLTPPPLRQGEEMLITSGDRGYLVRPKPPDLRFDPKVFSMIDWGRP